MTIHTELELKAAFKTLDQLLAEMFDDKDKQAHAQSLAKAIQEYAKKYVLFPTDIRN